MGWLVALPTVAALFVINKRVNPRNRGRVVVAVITMLVSFGAGCGLAYTFVGQWTATFVSWLGSMLSHFAGSGAGEGLSIALTILFVGIAVADIAFDRTADKGAQFAAIVVPTLLLLVVGGALHKTGGDAVKATQTQLSAMWSQMGKK
jgi:hypothetical protein